MKKYMAAGLLSLFLLAGTGAQTFEYKESNTDFILFSLSIPQQNPNIAYAAGSQFTTSTAAGTVVKTEDKGETWTVIYEGDNIQTMAFATTMKGFAGGYSPLLKKTIDGGQTWEEVSIGTDVYAYMILKFYDENRGIVLYMSEDYDLEVRTTQDGGETWELSTQPPMHGIIGLNYADENTLYAVGYSGSVYKTEDGGDIWTLIRQEGMDINMNTAFKDAETGVFAGESGDIYRTEDGGETWTNVLYTGYHFFDGLLYKNDKIMAAGTDEDVYLSADNGENFEFVFNGPGQNTFYDIGLFEDNSGLICGSGGTILGFDEVFLNTTEAVKDRVSIYPNPASDKIYINSPHIIEKAILKDMNGRTVAQTSMEDSSGEIDIQSLPKGVYILQLKTQKSTESFKILKQ